MAKSDPAPAEKADNLVERTLANLGNAWRDIAKGAARSVGLAAPTGLAGADPEALEEFMRDCLEARGGEVSARMRAAELGEAYLELDAAGRRKFLEVLARGFSVDDDSVRLAIAHYEATEPGEKRLAAENTLRRVLEPPRVKLLTQFTALPEGVKFLVDLRADLLALGSDDPDLRAMDRDLRGLLAAWFDLGFLDLRRIGWKSSAALLEKLIAYEAVHEITSWQDLRNRLDSDRRCYALFHPRMPEEPLAFVEVALTRGIVGHIQDLLDEDAPEADAGAADSAIFYSISNTQKGLRGISFGEYLIKAAVRELSHDLPGLKIFATLSPIPGFRRWLASRTPEDLGQDFGEDELGGLKALGGLDDPVAALREILERADWHLDPVTIKALKAPLTRLCARYLVTSGEDDRPLDSVARFHLRNGARLEKLNWLGDTSPHGLRQSAGFMVNYRYLLDDIEKNHEDYMGTGRIAMSSDFKAISRAAKEASNSGGARRLFG